MTEWHMKSRRKPSGGILRTMKRSDKKLAWRGGDFASTSIVQKEEEVLIEKGKGRAEKLKAKKAKYASITDRKTNKTTKAEIEKVILNPADRHFTRRNIITKGAIIQVKVGGKEEAARVTSRPGQSGAVEAVLLDEKERQELEKVKEQKAKPKKEPKKKEKVKEAGKKEPLKEEPEKEEKEPLKEEEEEKEGAEPKEESKEPKEKPAEEDKKEEKS